ncbi:MAG: 6-phosphofructokinase [Kiritimatiellae bacterium]|nr:6-phosphofructokinase [Kiritimatiellia bacterium]
MATIEGNMLIAQSGGPSMVINQSLVGAVLTAMASPRVGRVFGARHGIAGILKEDLVDLRKESRRNLELVAATPSSALGSVRRKPTPEDCVTIFKVLHRRGVRWFFYIGGNDSAETVHIINEEARKAGAALSCFHIPKTIDNDLLENDHTPGYGSAARFVACALMGDDLDNRALGGVKIDVIMGRHAGFLTAAAALARTAADDGPHLIYLPERPFDPKRFVADVQLVVKRLGRCVVAVSEGISDAKGVAIAAKFSKEKDSHGNVQLSGSGALGDLLAEMIRVQAGIKRVRADTFGYLQRSFPGIASAVDAREARQAGIEAVKAALAGKMSSGSVAIKRLPGSRYAVRYEVVPLRKVAKNTRGMPAAFINKAGNDVTGSFLDYARPIVGPLPPKALLKGVRAS